jgi:hypothetical protein
MKLRTLALFAAFALIGCSDDSDATVVEVTDSSTTETEVTDTSVDETAPPADTTVDETAPPADTMSGGDTMTTGDTAPTNSMQCGAVRCDAASQECCITAGAGVCIAKGGTCAGARYGCTSPTNCASGQVCCTSGAGTGGASCTATGSCPSSHLCDSDANCSGALKACCPVGSGIKACLNKCA